MMAATPTLWLDQCSAKCGLYSSKRSNDEMDDSAESELSEEEAAVDLSESENVNKLSSRGGDFNQYILDPVDK